MICRAVHGCGGQSLASLFGDPGFYPEPVHVKFLVEKVALVRRLLLVFRFSPASVIPSVLRTQLFACYVRFVVLIF